MVRVEYGSQLWWYTPVIPAHRRQRQEDHRKASLVYTMRGEK
jgi:hypothetical protein